MNAGALPAVNNTCAIFSAARRPSLAQLLAAGEPEEIGANLIGMLAGAHPRTAGGIALPRALWHMLYAMVAARVELRDRLGRRITWVSLREDLRFERYVELALDANLSGNAVAALEEHLAWLGVEPRHLEWLLAGPAVDGAPTYNRSAGALEAPAARELVRLRARHDGCVAALLGGGELPRWATTHRRRSTVSRQTTAGMTAAGAAVLLAIAWWQTAGSVAYGAVTLLAVAGLAAIGWAAFAWARGRRRAAAVDELRAGDARRAEDDLPHGGHSAVTEGERPAVVDPPPADGRLSEGDLRDGGEPPQAIDDGGAPLGDADHWPSIVGDASRADCELDSGGHRG